jgi:hypothetical protein
MEDFRRRDFQTKATSNMQYWAVYLSPVRTTLGSGLGELESICFSFSSLFLLVFEKFKS